MECGERVILALNMVSFGAFWVVFFQLSYLFYTQNGMIWYPSHNGALTALNIGNYLHPYKLTSFAVYSFPTAEGVLFVQN